LVIANRTRIRILTSAGTEPILRNVTRSARPEAFVLDARWLGYTGIGRVTRLLLEGLGELRPAGDWTVWGPPETEALAWPGSTFVPSRTTPLARFGQAGVRRVPRGRLVALHLVRPLVIRRRTVVLAHDTIPVRWANPRARRLAQHAFYALSAASAARVVTYSDTTREHVRHHLHVPDRRIRRVDLPIDLTLARAVRERRAQQPPRADLLLYVGLHEPHKNLARAVAGFAQSAFAADRGELHLVGAAAGTLDDLRRVARTYGGGRRVVVHGRCSDDELVGYYASATAVIQPSLEEGLGLTVIEALAGRVPTCCTAGGALAEAAAGAAISFDGYDVDSVARAIDATVERSACEWDAAFDAFASARPLPTPAEFAAAFIDAIR
jgi:glycosyltransferase involved in cell wall biosynthesis